MQISVIRYVPIVFSEFNKLPRRVGRICWLRRETRGGSSPPFGAMLETKGILALAGVPFLIEKCPEGKFWGSLE